MPLSGKVARLLPASLAETVQAGALGLSSRLRLGTNVFSREWDLLVVLDACRADALQAVADEYPFLPDEIPTIWSVGSSTMEWTGNTFIERYRETIAKTAVVTANNTITHGLEHDRFGVHGDLANRLTAWDTVGPSTPFLLEEVWSYAPTEPFGGLPVPEYTTDRAVSVGRNYTPDRCLVHYLPPHASYRARALAENRPLTPAEERPWEALQNGTPRAEVWDLYLDNLRWVLDSVGVLLRNYDADRAVITADHGDLFGEQGLYSHPSGVPHPALRWVPWVEVTATDTGEYQPSVTGETAGPQTSAEEQLENLGYL